MDRPTSVSFTVALRNGITVADLNLHATTRCEFRYNDRVGDFAVDSLVGLSTQPIIEGMKVGSGYDVLKVKRLHKKDERRLLIC